MDTNNFIQDTVYASGTSAVDPFSSTYPLYDIVTNTTTLSKLRTMAWLGQIYPSDSGYYREGGQNDYGKTYRLSVMGLLSTLASPGTLTLAVKIRTGTSDASNVYTTLQTLTFTPDGSLTNSPFWIEGYLTMEPQYPRSVTALFDFVGRGAYLGSAGYDKPLSFIDTTTGQVGWGSVTVPAQNIVAQMDAQWSVASASNILQIRKMVWHEV